MTHRCGISLHNNNLFKGGFLNVGSRQERRGSYSFEPPKNTITHVVRKLTIV